MRGGERGCWGGRGFEVTFGGTEEVFLEWKSGSLGCIALIVPEISHQRLATESAFWIHALTTYMKCGKEEIVHSSGRSRFGPLAVWSLASGILCGGVFCVNLVRFSLGLFLLSMLFFQKRRLTLWSC